MTIKLENYNENWPKIYASEKVAILSVAGQWIKAIEHVGSTSIPFITAKPTIDICIGVASLEQADQHMLKPLQQLGYEYLQILEKDIPERRYLQKLSSTGEHLVHVHIVIVNDELWNNYVRFRNYLIAHPEESKAYMALKHMLKEKFTYNREAYTSGKSDFIKDILSKAFNLEKNNT